MAVEQAVLDTLADMGLTGRRVHRAPGVYVRLIALQRTCPATTTCRLSWWLAKSVQLGLLMERLGTISSA